jgi:hypothetical protein
MGDGTVLAREIFIKKADFKSRLAANKLYLAISRF